MTGAGKLDLDREVQGLRADIRAFRNDIIKLNIASMIALVAFVWAILWCLTG